MKKYSSIIYIVGLACAGLIFTGCATNQARPRQCRLIQLICSLTGSQTSGAISALSCLLMARMWEALPRAEATVATCRQASTTIIVRVDPNPGGKRPGQKTLTVQAGQTYSYTAGWSGGSLVLVRNQGQTVPPIK